MNKILLVLIIISGFLLIFYANNDIFTRTGLFHGGSRNNNNNNTATFSPPAADGMDRVDSSDQNERLLLMDDPGGRPEEERRFWTTVNRTAYNLFVIYTKETEVLQKKYELLLKSLFKYTSTIPLHLHIITDDKSTKNAESIARKQMHRYHRQALISMLDVEQCVEKITDIVQVMMPYFTHPGRRFCFQIYITPSPTRLLNFKIKFQARTTETPCSTCR